MSSFRKRNVQKPIPGTRTSPQTGQCITSSGNPSLDLILGGGLPIGSICLIEEDKYVTHAKVLAKYFLAEGILSAQAIFLGSLDDEPAQLLRKLPKPLNEDEVENEHVDEANDDEGTPKNGLRIAWRYNDLPLVNSEQTTAKIGHHFNLLEHMDPLLLDFAETAVWSDAPPSAMDNDHGAGAEDDDDEAEIDHFVGHELAPTPPLAEDGDDESKHAKEIEIQKISKWYTKNTASLFGAGGDAADVGDAVATTTTSSTTEEAMDHDDSVPSSAPAASATVPAKQNNIFANPKYLRLLNELQPLLREDKFSVQGLTMGTLSLQRSLCRVCITSLGSPLWYDDGFPKDILKFLTVLRAAVRNSMAVCFITMPMHLVAKCDATLVSKIRNLVDYAIELESFVGSERETNPAFKEYNGLLHLRKMTAINTLSAYTPETTDLAFKLRRKKFVIEKLHLPPELQDDNSSTTPSPSETLIPSTQLSCASVGGGGGPGGKSKVSLDF